MMSAWVALALVRLLPASALRVSAPAKLRGLLATGKIAVMPCCYDGLTARLVERAGFGVTFMTGFGVAASRGYPDAGLASYGEMQDSARIIAGALAEIPFIADGDTGYGNAVNVRRTVAGYAQVGAAGVMIEDQVSPKRCGHTGVKAVVGRGEALDRVRAACDERDARADGDDRVVIVARTDANACEGFEEALARCEAFVEAGADVTFLEAPTSPEEMRRYGAIPGYKLANMLEGGKTPILPPAELGALGFSLAAYPLTLLSAATAAMRGALADLGDGRPAAGLLPFGDLCETVGFAEYEATAARYGGDEESRAGAPRGRGPGGGGP